MLGVAYSARVVTDLDKGVAMKNLGMFLALAPWILFSMIAEHIGTGAVGVAALIAGLGSLALAVRGGMQDGVKIIDVAGVVTFAALAVLGFSGDHHTQQL